VEIGDNLLGHQHPDGGWRGADLDAITFNDDLVTGITALLCEIRKDASHDTLPFRNG